ncbi:MAG: hypothetical protein AUG17_02850 [Crenarchaeota archaeon 13_1_20CM_2_53_14]|nr:MAG: hypothetical protein AUG17_02850 [Crenarchaeota archaeon 13_1_20CM_2_53_14]
MKTLNLSLLVILVLVLTIIPRAVLFRNEVADPFLFGNVAYVQRVLPTGHVLPIPPGDPYKDVLFHPALESMIAAIRLVTGLPIYQVQFLPIGGFLGLVTTYALVRRLANSRWLALGFVLYNAYEISLIDAASVFTAAWAFPLFLAFILVYLDIFHSKTVPRTVVLLLLFVGAHLYYYTVEVWMLVFSFTVNVLLVASRRGVRHAGGPLVNGRTTTNLTILFAAIFLAYNQIVYDQFLPTFEATNISESAFLFFSSLAGILPIPSGPLPRFSAPSSDPLFFALNLVFSIFVLVPVLIYVVRSGLGIIMGKRSKRFTDTEFFIWGNAATSAGDVVIYASYGPASVKSVLLRSLVFLLPLSALQSVGLLVRRREAIAIFLVVLVALAALRFGAAVTLTDNFRPPTFETTKSSFSWLSSNTNGSPRILSDFDTSGAYLLESSIFGEHFIAVDYSSDLYGQVAAPQSQSKGIAGSCDFVAVYALGIDRRISAPLWNFYQPLGGNLNGLESNTRLARVYDDGNVWLFATS